MSDVAGGTGIDGAAFREVLGHFPTGVTVVTAMHEGQPVGMAIGSFTSVSLDPALVAFLPTKDSVTWAAIRQAGAFCVNVMAHEQLDVCGVMASRSDDKFEGVGWHLSGTGSPIIGDSVAFIDCTIENVYDGGDHDIVVGQVQELRVLDSKDPLLFFRGDYGTFAG